jgi:hypothetical protein
LLNPSAVYDPSPEIVERNNPFPGALCFLSSKNPGGSLAGDLDSIWIHLPGKEDFFRGAFPAEYF